MPVFEWRSTVPVPVDDLAEWHVRPGAFERLRPPWQHVRVLERSGGRQAGGRMVLSVGVGPATHPLGRRDHRLRARPPLRRRPGQGPLRPLAPHPRLRAGRRRLEPAGGPRRLRAAPRRGRRLPRRRARPSLPGAPLPLPSPAHRRRSSLARRPPRQASSHRRHHRRLRPHRQRAGRLPHERRPPRHQARAPAAARRGRGLLGPGARRAGPGVAGGRGRGRPPGRPQHQLRPLDAGGQAGDPRQPPGRHRADRPHRSAAGPQAGAHLAVGDRHLRRPRRRGSGRVGRARAPTSWPAWPRPGKRRPQPARDAGARVVTLRTGIVLSGRGGALARMLPAYKLGVGGVVGGGQPVDELDRHGRLARHRPRPALRRGRRGPGERRRPARGRPTASSSTR